MKLFILLLIISCSKVKNTIVPESDKQEERASTLRIGPHDYSPQIDLLVAFLWPEKFRPRDKPDLKVIIKTGRELLHRKLAYQEAKAALRARYRQNNCPGADICFEIEDEIAELDSQLVDIYSLVDIMKEKVARIGGEWIDTNSEYPQEPLPSMDFAEGRLHLTVLGRPGHFEFSDPEIISHNDFQTMIYRKDEWVIKVTPKLYPVCLIMQGELKRDGRVGYIYWEHAKGQ